MPTFMFFEKGSPKGVDVQGLKNQRTVVRNGDGLVERILGADRAALEAIVKTLASGNEGQKN